VKAVSSSAPVSSSAAEEAPAPVAPVPEVDVLAV